MSKLKQYNMKIIKENQLTVILYRKDLSERFKELGNKYVEPWNFNEKCFSDINKGELVIFIHEDFSKILTSRYF